MGPFQMSDLAGLDVSWRIRQQAGETEPIADRLCEMSRFGQKTGAGYYRYRNGSRAPMPDRTVQEIVEEEGRKRHGERRRIGSEEIVERCLLALVNEGARILEEGIALRASDIDVVYVYGYGFPAWRGGPMFWADQQGIGTVCDKLAACFEAERGDVLKPAALIERLAEEGKGFADLDRGEAAAVEAGKAKGGKAGAVKTGAVKAGAKTAETKSTKAKTSGAKKTKASTTKASTSKGKAGKDKAG